MSKPKKASTEGEDKEPGNTNPVPATPGAQPCVKMNISWTHNLTQSERIERANEYFSKLEQVEVTEAQMKAAQNQFKDTISRLQAEAKEIQGPARTGLEQRTELCLVEFDTARSIRMCYECRPNGSKGDLVIELPMGREDFQTVLDFEQQLRNEEEAAKQQQEEEPPASGDYETQPPTEDTNSGGDGDDE